jgi:hypothetical protein
MELLGKLTPAETLFILQPSSLLNELMMYTLMDLLMQEKLALTNFDPNPVQGKPRLGYARVTIGKNFQKDPPKLHEMIFLFPFYKKPKKKIVLRHLLQMAMSAAKSETHFKETLLLDAEEMKPLFEKKFWQKALGGVRLSSAGKSVQQEIVKQFNTLDKLLPPVIGRDHAKALEMVRHIKGNILLLKSFKFDLILLIGREIGIVDEELEGEFSMMPE